MTTINEIMAAAYAPAALVAEGRSVCPRLAAAELRSIITQALAEARAEGARDAKREPVRLTDEQVRDCIDSSSYAVSQARAIETAVLAANGMTK